MPLGKENGQIFDELCRRKCGLEVLTDRFSLAAEMKLVPHPGASRVSDGGVVELHARQPDLSEKMQIR